MRSGGEYAAHHRAYAACGALQPLKDRRTRRLQTLFGTVEVEAPRFKVCRCRQPVPMTGVTVSPVCALLTGRCTPELERVQAELGARTSFRDAARILEALGMISAAALPPLTPHEQIFEAFSHYLREERGLAPKSIVRHLPFIRLFLREVCPDGAADLGQVGQECVARYVERHAGDWSAGTGKAMCWALRAFLRYLLLAAARVRVNPAPSPLLLPIVC